MHNLHQLINKFYIYFLKLNLIKSEYSNENILNIERNIKKEILDYSSDECSPLINKT